MSLRGRLEWIPLTLYGIFRNKRRSFAMISGIILGTVLLSGIFIYTSVLNQRNFESVVQNAVYEIRFDILDNETISSLEELGQLVNEDIRIIGSTVIGSHSDEDTFVSVIIDKEGEGEDGEIGEHTQMTGFGGISPVFVKNDFDQSIVGKTLLEKTAFDGEFDLISGNNTVLPRALASQYRLRIGDVIAQLNITYTTFGGRGPASGQEISSGSLSNITVVGIYEPTSGDAGFFGDIFSRQEFYLSFGLLNDLMPDLSNWMDTNNGRFLAVKIDANQFSVTDPEDMNQEIKSMINEMTKLANEAGIEIQGSNQISGLLLPFQITSFFVTLFDVLLAAPVVILSIYLLFFGLELSLEERRREIAIKKVQGADSGQIYGELRNESFILFLLGLIIGYLLGILSAWIISSAIGFMRFQSLDFVDFVDFFRIDTTAIVWSLIIVGGILTIQIIRRGKGYIEQEVTEQIQRFESKKEGLIRRLNIDIILFLIGVSGGVISVIEQGFRIDLDLPFLAALVINGFGPFFLWIGGALVGVRLSKTIPIKLEGFIFAFTFFKDIARIVKSGLRRRGDTDKLAIIIILTLSIATLAAAQGNTDEAHTIRTAEWQIGSDFQVTFQVPLDYSSNLTEIDGIINQLAFGRSPPIRILSSSFSLIGFDAEREYNNLKDEAAIGIWQSDAFDDMSAEEGLKLLTDNPRGIFVSGGTLFEITASINDLVDLKVDVVTNETSGEIDVRTIEEVKILGTFDHIPGGILGPTILANEFLVQQLNALSANLAENAYDDLSFNATNYLVKAANAGDMSVEEINILISELSQIDNYSNALSLYKELETLEIAGGSFGVPGLLTMNFIISVSASLISTFAFSAILMERRKNEFAVLRAIGAKQRQIYKVAIAENLMLVVTSVVWGTFIGAGITYQFNGVFAIFGVFLGGGPLPRLVVFPWVTIALIGLFTTLGMLLATGLSVRSAANQDLSIATRVV